MEEWIGCVFKCWRIFHRCFRKELDLSRQCYTREVQRRSERSALERPSMECYISQESHMMGILIMRPKPEAEQQRSLGRMWERRQRRSSEDCFSNASWTVATFTINSFENATLANILMPNYFDEWINPSWLILQKPWGDKNTQDIISIIKCILLK